MFIVNLFAAAGHALADWRHRQRAYAELMALDDHSLADIGIRRCDILAIVEGRREARARSQESELPSPFAAHRLAGGHTWFPWFPPL
jgi:uncharacterized protein YjiS (DUF1127 family)